MSIVTGDTIINVGGPLKDYSPVIDSTTDLPAAAWNTCAADVAALSRMRWPTWAKITTAGTGAPTLSAHEENWGAVGLSAPTLARSATGTYTLTYPTNVQDEIPSGYPGYTGPTPLNLRGGDAQARSGTTAYTVQVVSTSPNVLTVYVFASGSLTDTTGLVLDVWGF